MKRAFFLLLATYVLFIPLNATKYYVSPAGNDLNNGISLPNAFRTLQKAANIVKAGDTVLVSDSTYVGFDLRSSGTSSSPIVFIANGSNVIINRRNAITPDGINIENADWIVIDGFKVINQPRAGIRAVVANHITVRNNICQGNQRWGIFTGFTDNFTAEYNECATSVLEHGIYVSNSSDSAIIRYNRSHDNRAAGLHFNGDISQGGDGINHAPQVYGNILYNNGSGGGSAINMDGNQNALIYNNVLYNNFATGIALYQIDGGGPSTGARIYHNTIVQAATGRWAILLVDGAANATIKNNIVINQHAFRGSINVDPASRTGLISDFNILTNRFTLDDNTNIDSTAWKNLGYDVHSFFSPVISGLFKNYNAGDLSLSANSKAINFGTAGLTPGINIDINGLARPQGTAPDAGAFETPSAPLPLHWTVNQINRLKKGIEIRGTLVEAESPMNICLEKWNEQLKTFEVNECTMVHSTNQFYTVSFNRYPPVGNHIYRLVAHTSDGKTLPTKSMSYQVQAEKSMYFPNPTSGILYFNQPKSDGIIAIIFDESGRVVKYATAGKGLLDIHVLSQGKYLVNLVQGTEIIQSGWVLKN